MTISQNYISVLLFFLLVFCSKSGYSQLVSVGSLLDEQVEINALHSDSVSYSLVNRPLSMDNYRLLLNQKDGNSSWWNRDLSPTPLLSKQGFQIGILPTSIQQTYNSRIPYGENNGAAWYGRGSNIEFKSGFYITSKYLTINLNPHIIHNENVDFLVPRFIPEDSDGNIRYIAEGDGTRLDAPFRFGPDAFSTLDPGNSSIRLHYKKLETGLSTETLWWGPAVRYPLLISNNAAGIPHFFLGNRKPFHIPYFGSITIKWIFGYPQDSEYFDGPGQEETRFFSALNLAYRPFFFENLTVGLSRGTHLYEQNGFSLSNAIIPFDPFSFSTNFNSTGTQDKNQVASIYAQILLPGADAKIYGEFYREDHSHNARDFINQPHHNSAYSFGFQKLSYIPWLDFLRTSVEITNLTTSQLEQVRFQTEYYTQGRVRQGHTNSGEVLGAAIGPGSNSQFVSIDAFKGNYKLGLFAQRWVDNDNFHFEMGSRSIAPPDDFGDYFRHRVNINLGLNALYGPGPIYINSRLIWTKAYNYGRFDYGEFEGVTIQNYEKNDLINIQFQMGLTYIF